MNTYKVNDFGSRSALETQVIFDLGKTTEKKDAIITGTQKKLSEFGLEHNSQIWGVIVQETNYKVNNTPKVKRGIRGDRVSSKINGQKI